MSKRPDIVGADVFTTYVHILYRPYIRLSSACQYWEHRSGTVTTARTNTETKAELVFSQETAD
jgi:hypothetical protein